MVYKYGRQLCWHVCHWAGGIAFWCVLTCPCCSKKWVMWRQLISADRICFDICIGCSRGECRVVNFVFCEGLQSVAVQICWRRLMRTMEHSPFLDRVPLLLCFNENLRTNLFQIKTLKVLIYNKKVIDLGTSWIDISGELSTFTSSGSLSLSLSLSSLTSPKSRLKDLDGGDKVGVFDIGLLVVSSDVWMSAFVLIVLDFVTDTVFSVRANGAAVFTAAFLTFFLAGALVSLARLLLGLPFW